MFFSKVMKAIDHPYMVQKDGFQANNGTKMQGTTLKSLKHHVALQPLFAIIGAGTVMVCAYILRLASKTTDVNWMKNKDPTAPMKYYENRQFKFLNPSGLDYSTLSNDRPKY